MTLLVIIIAAILVAIIVLLLRLFSIERVVVDQNDDDGPTEPIQDAEAESPEENPADLSEMVNVVDYFNEDDKKDPEEEKTTADGVYEPPSATDDLTELKRGRGYLVDCQRLLEAAKNDGHIYCACYLDYDRFSYINSLKGAASGDFVLVNTAQQMRRIFPEGSLISRISCDHFTVIFPLVNLALFDEYYESLKRMCEKIRTDLAAKTGMRISVGFATTDNDSSYDINILLTRANVARHCSKVTKSEKFETYDETMITSNFYGDTLSDDYTECQYGDTIAIYFETQVDLVSDKVVGCDALVRWAFEDSGSTLITQETGTIPTNNDKVIYHVCRSMSRWRKAAREAVLVFVGIPIIDLFKVDIDEFIAKCFAEFQIDPHTFVAKIDVSCVRLDWSMCSRQFKKLHDMGIVICISGMDTGYSNLDFLSGLPIDYIKLHRSFAHNIDKSPENLDKCRKIIGRAASIGAKVIFEGVDTMDQVIALRSINAKTVQGRYSGRPYTTDDLTRSLPEHIERRTSDQTVILDEAQLSKGDYNLF